MVFENHRPKSEKSLAWKSVVHKLVLNYRSFFFPYRGTHHLPFPLVNPPPFDLIFSAPGTFQWPCEVWCPPPLDKEALNWEGRRDGPALNKVSTIWRVDVTIKIASVSSGFIAFPPRKSWCPTPKISTLKNGRGKRKALTGGHPHQMTTNSHTTHFPHLLKINIYRGWQKNV